MNVAFHQGRTPVLCRKIFGGIFLFFFLFAISAHAVDAPYDKLVGKAYALVITGPAEDALYIEQLALLKPAAQGLIDRAVVVIHFKDRRQDTLDALSVYPYRFKFLEDTREQKYQQKLLGVDDDVFSVVLVGKDGVAMQSWPAVVPPGEIFRRIDADSAP